MFWCEHIYVAFSTIYVGYLTLCRKSAYLRRKKISCSYLCIFLVHLVLQISCIFLHILICVSWHIYPCAYSSLFRHILHLLCLPRPISLINIQTAAGAQRERCFFRRPSFLSFNCPHTRLKITVRRLADKGSAEGV